MRRLIAMLVVSLLAGLGSPALGAVRAPTEDAADKIHSQCRNAEPDAVADCVLAKEKDYGRKLADKYQSVVELQGAAEKKLLVESQRAWLSYQEKSCKFHEQALAFDGADAARAAGAVCLLRTTLQRLAEFDALLPKLEH